MKTPEEYASEGLVTVGRAELEAVFRRCQREAIEAALSIAQRNGTNETIDAIRALLTPATPARRDEGGAK